MKVWRWFGYFALIMPLTFVIHEGAHWAAGEAMGYDMVMRINSAHLAGGNYANSLHENLVSAAGPLVTIVQGVIALAAIYAWRSMGGFVCLFAATYMRLLASAASLKQPNDEARISLWLGYDYWALHAAVIAFLVLLLAIGFVRLQLKWPALAWSFAAASVFTTVVIVSERFLPAVG